MRFPLPLTLKIAANLLGKRWRGVKRFATVLQLEPLHACNLSCTGCGRIREYAAFLRERMTLDDCLAAATECDAPMISICGGEPLLYSDIEALVSGLRAQGRIVYLCTNALLMRRKMCEYLAVRWMKNPRQFEPLLYQLVLENLISQKDAALIRTRRMTVREPVIEPSVWFYWNVHIDGLEDTHDRIVERDGVFKECILAIRMAKALGYQVATNTTVYKETEPAEIEELWRFLGTLGVDGHTISPGYDYSDAARAMIERKKGRPEDFFLTRAATVEKFSQAEEWGRRFPLLGTPAYLEFLAGKRNLACSAWAIPTRNVRGWKGPCYLITDAHYPTYRELLESTDWSRLGTVDGVARDPRCEHCMVHCGHEPTATLGIGARPGDTWKNIRFNFGPRPHQTTAKP